MEKIVLKPDSAKKLKELFRAGGDGFSDLAERNQGQTGDNRVAIVQALETTGYTSVSGPIIWTGNVITFDDAQVPTLVGDVYLADEANALVADVYYVAIECGAIPDPVPSGSGLTAGTSVFVCDSRGGSGLIASCSVPAGMVTNVAQTFCGAKSFSDLVYIGAYYEGSYTYPGVIGAEDIGGDTTNPQLSLVAYTPDYSTILNIQSQQGRVVVTAQYPGSLSKYSLDRSGSIVDGADGTMLDGSGVTGGIITSISDGSTFFTGTL